jgi:TolA-binding protein
MLFRSRACFLMLISLLAISSCAKAQDAGSKAGQLWKQAQAAFSSGNFAQSATTLEDLIKSTGASTHWFDHTEVPPATAKQQWIEPVYFMLAASYFNAKDWPNAIITLKKYGQLFPRSTRLTQVKFSLAQADYLGAAPKDAVPLLESLKEIPEYHVRAVLLLVEAHKAAHDIPAAIALLEKETVLPNIAPDYLSKVDMRLAQLYVENKQADKAVALLEQMDANIEQVEDVTQFNSLAIRLGDLFLDAKQIDAALQCYRRVRPNDVILTLQAHQIDKLHAESDANLKRIQADPLNSSDLQLENSEIATRIAADQKILEQYKTLPPILPPLFLRIAKAYTLNDRLWEAAVVYRETMRRFPDIPEAEGALYGSIVIFERLKQTEHAQALAADYLKRYPKGKYADSVAYLRGALAYDAEDFDQAIAYFQDCLKTQPNNPRCEQIELIIGDISLREAKLDQALASYQKYLKDYPHGSFVEQATYRSALAELFNSKNDVAEKGFHAYLEKYPKGAYAADAEYRLNVIAFGQNKYDEVLAACDAWQKKYGKAAPLAEVYSLRGDCYDSLNRPDDAVAAYNQSWKAAQTTEVLNYAIFAAAKLTQKQAKWDAIVAMFQDFLKANPDHPTTVSAVAWIGRADIKLGKVDEARKFMADAAQKYLNDPTKEGVDEIITQLAQLYARKSLGATTGTLTATSTPPADPAASLAAMLTGTAANLGPTARARIIYAQSELARLQKKPDIEQGLLLQIAKQFSPEDLSPIMLGQTGDALVAAGQPQQAVPFYNQLLDAYDNSPVVDYAYNGLGRIAYDQKDYLTAERYYGKALDKGLASAKQKDITLGQAQTLLALKRPAEAQAFFEQVASNRAWRGEATAISVLSLGDIQMDAGKFPEANAFYQRVFVAYQKYPAVQAKAYLRSGQAFEKLGKMTDAINTYSEMLHNPNLAAFPEASDAQKRLNQLAQK